MATPPAARLIDKSIRCIFALLVTAIILGWQPGAAAMGERPAAEAPSPQEELVIESSGRRHLFSVEVARDEAAHERGLMYRRHLAPDHGMLFDFGRPRPAAMWMRNTYIPLDILFIDGVGRITKIHPQAQPHDETPIESNGRVRAVLELPGGTSERLGLKVGDRIRHPLFRVR